MTTTSSDRRDNTPPQTWLPPSARGARSSTRACLAACLLAAGLVPGLLTGCAFFGKVEPLAPRYYDPELDVSEGKSVAPSLVRPSLRLGHVLGGSHLRERIAYRVSEREVGFYDERRWTERPENYLRRALARSLFEQRGIASLVTGVGPSLDVELVDFSELLEPKHAVRVRARAVLVDQRTVRFEHTFGAEEPVRGGDDADFTNVADAMARALARTVDEIGDRVLTELTTPPAPATGGDAAPVTR
jgi:cholesterol transport system auxiliary component